MPATENVFREGPSAGQIDPGPFKKAMLGVAITIVILMLLLVLAVYSTYCRAVGRPIISSQVESSGGNRSTQVQQQQEPPTTYFRKVTVTYDPVRVMGEPGYHLKVTSGTAPILERSNVDPEWFSAREHPDYNTGDKPLYWLEFKMDPNYSLANGSPSVAEIWCEYTKN